ncbi:DUF294 nucleotidyltransferase-like domain-containing protein [Alphaproteobacteria bacterium LSUCC0684]
MTTLATMPLEKLPLASIDLETTGLSPARDRIVQIGMTDPWDETHQLDLLVNPGMAIPEKSTTIHGIDDQQVKTAQSIAHVLPHFRARLNGRVLIGYNIGFDLAVLSAEAERYGLEWEWSAALCVRQLGVIALGNEAMLMMGDLNALAEHYDISISDRHTALGDARITGRIFRAMLPDLNGKSIVTLADALRSVSGLDDLRLSSTRAGWVDVASGLYQPSQTRPVERIDPYPYRHRIREIMLTDPVVLPPETPIQIAAVTMKDRKTDCVFIGPSTNKIDGIVSERDLVHTMALPIEEVGHARAIPIGQVMSSPVITVREDDFMHVALGRISRLDIRHLGVVGASGELVGWISTRELIRQRVTGAMVIGDQIATARDSAEIAAALKALPMLASSLLSDGVEGHLIAAVISSQYRAALAQAAQLAEARMETPPPRPYAVLVLGSAGRGESLLAADQDHAIIYDDGIEGDGAMPDDAAVQAWYETLGGHISDFLDEAGIPYCQGGVMSRHAKWCRSISGWRSALSDWVKLARPEDLLSVDIFFDFEPVYGQVELASLLRLAMEGRATRRPDFLKRLAGSAANAQAGTTLFGGLKTEAGRYDIKKYLLLPLIETLRVLSISRGISERSSAQRAEALYRTNTVPPEVPLLAEDIHFALKLVLRQQISDISAGLPPGTRIEITALSPAETKLLKSIRGRVNRLEPMLQDCLFG